MPICKLNQTQETESEKARQSTTKFDHILEDTKLEMSLGTSHYTRLLSTTQLPCLSWELQGASFVSKEFLCTEPTSLTRRNRTHKNNTILEAEVICIGHYSPVDMPRGDVFAHRTCSSVSLFYVVYLNTEITDNGRHAPLI